MPITQVKTKTSIGKKVNYKATWAYGKGWQHEAICSNI